MAFPIFKPEDNKEYTATMLGGPYGDNDSTGPVQGKFGPQWKYLVRIGEDAKYWYVTPRTQEMIAKMGYDTKQAPFSILKRVEDGKNKGFELSGESYDTIFPKEQADEKSPEIDAPPLSPDNQATLDKHIEQGPPKTPLEELEGRMVAFSEAMNERMRGVENRVAKLEPDKTRSLAQAEDIDDYRHND